MAVIIKIISGALAGTSLMTALSYTLAYLFNKQFKEPVLLNLLLRRSHFYEGRHVWPGFGWLIHYGIGLILVITYHFIWGWTAVNRTVTSGSILGFASGLVGVAWWSTTFRLHADPPDIDFGTYYLQLVFVHIFFGIGATAGYRILG